jgi:NAD(P)-dependent dehydrogenase (short-subunit alcohol dehydrogenase family)
MGQLDGKTAIVLGAAGPGNMGQVIARRFLENGAKVVVAGRKQETLAAFAAENNCDYGLCDITDKSQLEALVTTTVEKHGAVHIGVNATGWGLLKPFLETTPEELAAITALQFFGPFYFIQALVPAMKQGGSIIQISSATATIMLENHAAYMGTKAGADHVVRCAANDFGAQGIRVNSISPGLTDTPMTTGVFQMQKMVDVFAKEYPLGRVGTSEDIADAALWLAGDHCFMTGQNLQVNGGLTLRRNPRAEEFAAAFAG